MRIKEGIIKTNTYEITVGFTCDRCGKRIVDNSVVVIKNFELRHEVSSGTATSGGVCEARYVDLCDDCVEWLFSKLENCGVKINTEEIDW